MPFSFPASICLKELEVLRLSMGILYGLARAEHPKSLEVPSKGFRRCFELFPPASLIGYDWIR